MSSPAASRLSALRDGLLHLHKKLLDSERAAYEHDVSKIHSSGHLLELVLNDPAFAWLRELSQLVVVIDEALDAEEPVTPAEADRMIARARGLLTASETGDDFQRRYYEAFQRDPGTVIAHGEMMKVFAAVDGLPRPPGPVPS